MLITRSGFTMFSEYDLRTYLEDRNARLIKEIESNRAILVSGFDENKYVSNLIEKNRINPLILHADKSRDFYFGA